jgi:hypothetical protein
VKGAARTAAGSSPSSLLYPLLPRSFSWNEVGAPGFNSFPSAEGKYRWWQRPQFSPEAGAAAFAPWSERTFYLVRSIAGCSRSPPGNPAVGSASIAGRYRRERHRPVSGASFSAFSCASGHPLGSSASGHLPGRGTLSPRHENRPPPPGLRPGLLPGLPRPLASETACGACSQVTRRPVRSYLLQIRRTQSLQPLLS